VRDVTIDRSATVTSQGLGDDNVKGGIDYKSSGASGAGHGGSGGEGHENVRTPQVVDFEMKYYVLQLVSPKMSLARMSEHFFPMCEN